MFQLTESAARTLQAALANKECAEDACFRIGASEGQLRIGLDQQRPGDATIEHEGQIVLVVDSETSEALAGRQLDVDETTSQLVLR
jgi:Fe-S cluster assembly iron-binding protein IscA